jgi:ketosteroid isomerase-like protein
MNPVVIATFIEQLPSAFRKGDPSASTKRPEAENVRLLQEQYRAIGRHDFNAALAYFADDVELEVLGPPDLPIVGHWHGRAEVATALAKNFALLADQEPVIHDLVAQGDSVVLFIRERGRFLPTGRGYDVTFVQMFQFRDGKVFRIREICDHTSLALAAQV